MIETLKTKYANEIEYLQSVFNDLGITANESILVVKIDNAYTAIRNYLRLDKTADVSEYFTAACELATSYYNNAMRDLKKLSGEKIIVQQSQGSVSNTFESSKQTFDANGLTESVKAMLPYPPVRVF